MYSLIIFTIAYLKFYLNIIFNLEKKKKKILPSFLPFFLDSG